MANKLTIFVRKINNIIKTKMEERKIRNEERQEQIYRSARRKNDELYNNPHRMTYNVVGGGRY